MLIGHQFQWQYLKKTAEAGKIPHAFLFSGPDHTGKRKVAVEFTKLICCRGSNENGAFRTIPCQNCENCKKIEKAIHPDLTLIEPLKSPTFAKVSGGKPSFAKASEGKQIQISQIRELAALLRLRPYSAPFKIVIIDEAHCMRKTAQSAFLKLLEEPKGNTLFILITPFSKMLLPTILSRTQVVKFYRVPDLEIKRYLADRGVSEKTALEIINFSEGRPGRAIDFLCSPQELESQKKTIKELINILNSDIVGRFQYVKELSSSPNLRKILDIWVFYFRNILLLKINNPQPVPPLDYSLEKLKNIIKNVQNTNFLISTTNINSRLALEILMLNF